MISVVPVTNMSGEATPTQEAAEAEQRDLPLDRSIYKERKEAAIFILLQTLTRDGRYISLILHGAASMILKLELKRLPSSHRIIYRKRHGYTLSHHGRTIFTTVEAICWVATRKYRVQEAKAEWSVDHVPG